MYLSVILRIVLKIMILYVYNNMYIMKERERKVFFLKTDGSTTRG